MLIGLSDTRVKGGPQTNLIEWCFNEIEESQLVSELVLYTWNVYMTGNDISLRDAVQR